MEVALCENRIIAMKFYVKMISYQLFFQQTDYYAILCLDHSRLVWFSCSIPIEVISSELARLKGWSCIYIIALFFGMVLRRLDKSQRIACVFLELKSSNSKVGKLWRCSSSGGHLVALIYLTVKEEHFGFFLHLFFSLLKHCFVNDL